MVVETVTVAASLSVSVFVVTNGAAVALTVGKVYPPVPPPPVLHVSSTEILNVNVDSVAVEVPA